MDEVELAEKLQADLIDLIRKEPLLALLAAAQLDGWTVIPPPDVEEDWSEVLGGEAFTLENVARALTR